MKRLHLSSPSFKYLEQSFKEWLELTGYSERTVRLSPLQVREFFYYLEQQGINHPSQIKPAHARAFKQHLLTRENLQLGGGLSASSINTYITSLHLLAAYIAQNSRYMMDIRLKRLAPETEERSILSREEIRLLYESTFEPHPVFNQTAMGQRDRAIIGILYGCGLRKSEASRLNIEDVDISKRLAFVKKGKGNRQRYVPIAARHNEDIRAYLEEGRHWFLQDNRSAWHSRKGLKKQDADKEAFFLGVQGKRMGSFQDRLDYMKERAGIETSFSTHSLRHSIATHLLQSGMPLEEIARFLGHSTLESTQIYTHMAERLNQPPHEHESLL